MSSPAGCATPSRAPRRATSRTSRGRLITVFSAKGGCGKTTLATNLAAALADRGRREVCLVDLDLAFGDVAIALQLFPAHTIADAVPLADSLDASARRLAAHAALARPDDPGRADRAGHRRVDPGDAGVGACSTLLKEQFDFVVVDTPPAFDDHVLAAFDQSDMVALLATLDIPALKNLKLTLETLDLLNYPRDRWRLVLNRADSKVGLAVSEVEKTLKAPISVQIPQLARRAGLDQPRRADRARRPQAPGVARRSRRSPRTTSPPARSHRRARHPHRAAR